MTRIIKFLEHWSGGKIVKYEVTPDGSTLAGSTLIFKIWNYLTDSRRANSDSTPTGVYARYTPIGVYPLIYTSKLGRYAWQTTRIYW